jgi:hypothetical protein
MIRLILLALTLLSSLAHADFKQCNGLQTSNGVCIGSESNVPPTIIRCDYETPNRDPRCVGVGPGDGPSTAERPRRKSPR